MDNKVDDFLEDTIIEELTDDIEPLEEPKDTKTKKGITMNLKMLFGFGIGGVALICAIVAAVVLLNTEKYTVSFDTDGGSKIASIKVKKNKTVERPKNPTKKDYQFVEWQLDGKKYDFDKKVTKNITLKATWEIKLTDDVYTVTFDTDGGSTVNSQEVNGNGTVLKPTDPTKEHFKFVEWQLNGEKYDFDSLVKESITLKAVWEAVPIRKITIDYDGGGTNTIQEVYEGDIVKTPKTPKKAGFTFVEWQKDGYKYDFETPVIGDMTLTAYYTEKPTYRVTFDLAIPNSNQGIPGQIVEENAKAKKPNNDPTRNNYSFAGWTLNGQDYNFDTPVKQDIKLVAKWVELKLCNITLIDNLADGGSSIGSIKVKCGNALPTSRLIEQTKDYCTRLYFLPDCSGFKWYLNGSPFDFNTPINEDITLMMQH